MSDTAFECRARAAALRTSHGDSPLVNVRDRYELAAQKWDAMAVQAERTAKSREARQAVAAEETH